MIFQGGDLLQGHRSRDRIIRLTPPCLPLCFPDAHSSIRSQMPEEFMCLLGQDFIQEDCRLKSLIGPPLSCTHCQLLRTHHPTDLYLPFYVAPLLVQAVAWKGLPYKSTAPRDPRLPRPHTAAVPLMIIVCCALPIKHTLLSVRILRIFGAS